MAPLQHSERTYWPGTSKIWLPWNETESKSPLLVFPREIRDKIYDEYVVVQATADVPQSYTCHPCPYYICNTEIVPRPRYSFPLLFANVQILLELQETLLKGQFCLHFDCIHSLGKFLGVPKTLPLRQKLSALEFHWRASSFSTHISSAMADLQTLPVLSHLTILISEPPPLWPRAEFFSKQMAGLAKRDFLYEIFDAIGFDELTSVRGLRDVRVDLLDQSPKEQEVALTKYLRKFVTRPRQKGYGEVLRTRTPYIPYDQLPKAQWVGWESYGVRKIPEDTDIVENGNGDDATGADGGHSDGEGHLHNAEHSTAVDHKDREAASGDTGEESDIESFGGYDEILFLF